MINTTILSVLSREYPKTSPEHIRALLELHESQASASFIARYRPDTVGGLDERRILRILDHYRELCWLWSRKRHILGVIEDSGLLTPELSEKIEAYLDKWELEDIFLPFRPRNRTKATSARERGLEPLAEVLWDQQAPTPPGEIAAPYVDPEKNIETIEAAIEGAVHIMAEWVAFNPNARKTVRDMIWEDGKYESHLAPNHDGRKSKYDTYHDFSEPVHSIPSHRLLAIRRGVKERWLQASITIDHEQVLAKLREQFIIEPEFPGHEIIDRAVVYGYEKLMLRAISGEVTDGLNEKADAEAIDIFCRNLRNLLLMPAAGNVPAIGIEPSPAGAEVRVVAVDAAGTPVEVASIFPGPEDARPEESAATLKELIERHDPAAIVAGSGSGSRAADDFVRKLLNEAFPESETRKIARVVMNESGASIYSNSKTAKEELEDLDAATRSALTLVRRFQDPLAELLKVDPRAIGVGQYQHIVDQHRLRNKLRAAVESCVNAVGADANTASFSMLACVSGINRGTSRRIVEHRNLHGNFTGLEALKEIAAVNDLVFQQAAGFLRLAGADEPLDDTPIHPEHYEIVRKMAADLSIETTELIGNKELISAIDAEKYVGEEIGLLSVHNLLRDLRNPRRDPRRKREKAHFDDSISSLEDLNEGMMLEGTVTNVTNFGAFVDIGVHQDGLVHVSELSGTYVRDPNDAVRIGEVVKVKVLAIDTERSRISLSIKKAGKPSAAGQKRRKTKRPKTKGREDHRPITPADIKKLVDRLATR
ncbi:MAG: S1 RNA-binding domain-containing protein [Planctomycetes bacterium]|nr:S1 RNA-binding domain-containing protein [Planctomycetota bacterium]